MKLCKDCKHNTQRWVCSNINVIVRDKKAYSLLMVVGKDNINVRVQCSKARRRGDLCGEMAQYWEEK